MEVSLSRPMNSSSTSSTYYDSQQKQRMRAQRASYWDEIEDQLITQQKNKLADARCVEKHWKEIAIQVNMRTNNERTWKQVKYRWLRHLDPKINKRPFTVEEEQQIIAAQKQLGNKWTEISSLLPGRTYWQIKNLWFMKLKKIVEAGENPTVTTLQAKNDEYLMKCGDFDAPNMNPLQSKTGTECSATNDRRSLFSNSTMNSQYSYNTCAGNELNTENNPNLQNTVSGFSMHSLPNQKKTKMLLPKAEQKRKQHLNLLANIISMPLLFTNENPKLDNIPDNDSFFQVSPIALCRNKQQSQRARNLSLGSLTSPYYCPPEEQHQHLQSEDYRADSFGYHGTPASVAAKRFRDSIQKYDLVDSFDGFDGLCDVEPAVSNLDQLELMDSALSSSQSRSYGLFENNDYPPPRKRAKIETTSRPSRAETQARGYVLQDIKSNLNRVH